MSRSTITIKLYTEKHRALWDTFVDTANNGTMFHKQTFLAYHPAERFLFHHLMFYEGEELVAVLPGGIKQNFHNREVFWSPIGASYGGLVTGDISFERALRLVDALIEYGRRAGWSDIYMIPPPIIYNRVMTQHLEYAMLYRRFDYELHYISHAVDLSMGADSEDVIEQYGKSARKTVRKILREGRITTAERSDDESYRVFYEILLENKRKHNATPTHSLGEMIKLRELMPENIKLLSVYHDGKPIAGSWLFVCNRDVVLCFYNMLLYEYQHLNPIYLVMHETVRWAHANGYRWVDIGVSQVPGDPDPMTPSMNLIEFKERFHARGVIRSTYHYAFV